MPGMIVAPGRSTTMAPAAAATVAAGPAASMREPRTTTAHPSCMRAPSNTRAGFRTVTWFWLAGVCARAKPDTSPTNAITIGSLFTSSPLWCAFPTSNLLTSLLTSDFPLTSAFCLLPPDFAFALRARTRERPRKASRSSAALEADVGPVVRPHARPSGFEPRLRLRVACDHDAIARSHGQDVGAHRVELRVRHLNELHAARGELFDEGDGHQRQIDDREIVIDGADNRHQVEDVARAAPVR